MSGAAEYAGGTWLAAAASAFRHGTPGRVVDELVLHITDGHPSAENVAQMFATAGCRTSAHFIVGQAGEIFQCVALDDIAYHAHTANGRSVGIEHCARSPGELSSTDPGLALSEAQIAASLQLVSWLCGRYGLPMDRTHVLGHKEADPVTDHDDCPTGVAGGWPWARWCMAI